MNSIKKQFNSTNHHYKIKRSDIFSKPTGKNFIQSGSEVPIIIKSKREQIGLIPQAMRGESVVT